MERTRYMGGYVLGVDGGGTKTDCFLFDMKGRKHACVRGGGTNHELFADGFEQAGAELRRLVEQTLALGGVTADQISAAVFGMSGIDTRRTEETARKLVAGLGLKRFVVCNDSFLGIKAAIPKGYGIAMVNGTGNSVGGIDPSGKCVQVGGLGYFTGEEGGGRNISLQTLRCVYDELFRLGPRTEMTEAVLSLLGVTEIYRFAEQAKEALYSGALPDKDLHQILFDCADRGDGEAVGLLQRLGESFARSIAGCASHLELGPEVDVVLIGSVTLKATSPILRDHLSASLEALSPQRFRLIPLTVSPAVGAVLWAMELADRDTPRAEMLERVALAVGGKEWEREPGAHS